MKHKIDRPRLLDLFAGAGGAGEGYRRAGFHLVGVDIVKQPHNPHEFYQDDALRVLDVLLAGEEWNGYRLHDFQVIHASPPCQDYSTLKARTNRDYPRLIGPTRKRLSALNIPWVMENVMTAPLDSGITLCGAMFGLRTYRHRRFESSHLLFAPLHPKHVAKTTTRKRRNDFAAGVFLSVTGDVGAWCGPETMGIDWMTGKELSQAIPPAYTAFIGKQLMSALESAGQFASQLLHNTTFLVPSYYFWRLPHCGVTAERSVELSRLDGACANCTVRSRQGRLSCQISPTLSQRR